MPRRWSGTLAVQTAHFRGTSTVGISQTAGYPIFRHISDAVYTAVVTGGVSGTFAVIVNGMVGTTIYPIAGLTAVNSARAAVLAPCGYTATTGAVMPIGGAMALGDAVRLDLTTPPYNVQLQTGVATAGASAVVTVQAMLVGDD